jgi:hypothetical protein
VADALGVAGGANDPSQLLDALRGISDDIDDLGSDEVRGVATTHFHTTIDLTRALREAAPDQRELLDAQLGALAGGSSSVPFDVWIDRDGLPRRISVELDGLVQAPGAGTVTMAVDFFDYGEPVDIVIPDASDTTPFTDVLGSFGGLS